MTCRPSSGGRIASSSSCSRSSAMRRSRSSMRRCERARPVLVARGAVAALQVVELVEQGAGVAHVAAHRLVGPAHRVGVDAQVQVHELHDVVDHVVRVLQRAQPLLGHARRRPPRGGGSSRRRRRTSGSWACRRRGTARPGARAARGACSRTTAIVCASTSLWRWIGSCSRRMRLSSGRNSSASPVSARNQRPAAGVVDEQELGELVADALRARRSRGGGAARRPRRRARARARGRTARRSAPRAACAAGRRRTTPRARAACAAGGPRGRPTPPNGSTSSGSGSRSAIALTVKSRRERSVSMSSAKTTSGLRLSGR